MKHPASNLGAVAPHERTRTPRPTRSVAATLHATLALGWLMMIVGWAAARATESDPPLKPQVLNVGFARNAFLNLHRNDAEAAFKVFTQTLGMKLGYAINTSVTAFESTEQLEAALRASQLHLVIPDTWTYLDLESTGLIEPRFVSADREQVAKRYLILTRKDPAPDTLASLRGKTLNVYAVANANLGRYWLETLLLEQQLGRSETFFREIEAHGKPTAVVLPVFFGKRDACLVDSTGFALMTELNPQVGQQLRVLTESEPLVNAVIGLSRIEWAEPFRRDVISALTDLHLEPAGQQVLTLFKTGRLAPFDPAALDSVRRLRARSLGIRPSPSVSPKSSLE